MSIRPYDPERDLTSLTRLWREIGWIDDSADQAKGLAAFLSVGDAMVADLDGRAESMAHRVPGTIRYQDTDLPFSAVTAVTTSLVGRKQGFASSLTARLLADAAHDGAAVSGLGIFEQGFYERLGFGTGGYDRLAHFDPEALLVDVPYRTPVRLGPDDWAEMHQALSRRTRHHGSIVLSPPEIIQAELAMSEHVFGLGYRTGGELTHFLAGSIKGENGPNHIDWLAYQSTAQLLELLRLLRELSDQWWTVRLPEPPELQIQDLLRSPLRHRRSAVEASPGGAMRIDSVAWNQLRILDLAACVGARSWSGEPLRCNLTLHDPIADFPDAGWAGIGGDHTISLGPTSRATPGHQPDLPLLTAGVGPFTRCWFGVRPATSLAALGGLMGPPDLLARLDDALRLPSPHPTWFY